MATSNTNIEDYTKVGDTPTSLYGATDRNTDWEKPALQEEQAIEKSAIQSNIVNPQFVLTLSSDPSIISFYVNALAYGGYTIGDVLNDMKRRELISTGNVDAKNLKIIDPEVNRNTYQNTAEGQQSVQDTASIIPTFNIQGLLNPEILKYGANIPDELFKTLVPILDRNSQEFKDAVATVKATYYDLATAQLQATTDQQKAVADYNLSNFKDQLETQYGILLSDDATKAWSQIETLEDTMGTRGISGSGLEQEGIDQILATTRKQDQRLRQDKLTKDEAQNASYYTTSASADEINRLTPEQRQNYGLTPSAEILDKFSVASLKAQYPNKTDAEIQAIHDSVIDANGNYRSTLYSKKYTELSKQVTTDQTNAENQVLLDAQNKEAKAYRNYDQTQPFSVATPADNTQMKNDAQTDTNKNVPINTKAITNAVSNITSNLNSTPSTSTTPASTTPKPVVPVTTPKTPAATSTPDSTALTPGQFGGATSPSTSVVSPYKIAYGDTLSSIAAKNKTTVAALAKLNNISDPNKIQAGQTIKFQ